MITAPNCYKRKCRHYIGIINDGDETTERPACKAYRNGIPQEIVNGDDLHLEVRADQNNNIVFEKENEN